MKKILSVFLGSFVLLWTFPISTQATDSTQDISCSYQSSALYDNVDGSGTYYQTFKPTKNRLTKINVTLGEYENVADVTMKILSNSDVELATQTITIPNLTGTIPTPYTFDAFPEVTVIPGDWYKLKLIRDRGATLYWYKTTQCTAEGNIYTNGTPWTGADFIFTSWGYNYTAPVDEDTATTATNTSAGEAPAATTSATIKAASALKAEYNSADSTVRLSWTKSSTTDIDGYKVYRSELATSGFKEIGKTNATTITYADSTALTANKTYYYLVRAYKTTAQSANSNTAEIIIPAAATTASTDTTTTAKKRSPLDLVYVDMNESPIVIYLGMAAALLVLLLIAYQLFRYNRRHLLTAPDATFRLNKK